MAKLLATVDIVQLLRDASSYAPEELNFEGSKEPDLQLAQADARRAESVCVIEGAQAPLDGRGVRVMLSSFRFSHMNTR